MSPATLAAASAALGAFVTFVHWHQQGRVRPQRLPTAQFVPAIAPAARRRGRLARPALWALRLGIVAALAAAMGPPPGRAPLPAPPGPTAAPLALVIDTSASMAQPVGSGTAFTEAKRRALQAAQAALQSGRSVSLWVAAGPEETRLDVPASRDGAALSAALEALPLAGHATLDAALARANADITRPGPAGSGIVFTDGAAHAWDFGAARWPSGPVTWRLDVARPPTPPRNDAVLSLTAAWLPDGGARIEARLARYGGAKGTRTLRLRADGALLQRDSVMLAPGQSQAWSARVRLPALREVAGAPIAVSLAFESSLPDALAADDTRTAWLVPAGRGQLAAVIDPGRESEDPTAYVARALAHPSATEVHVDVAPQGPLATVAASGARALLLADVGALPGLGAPAGPEAVQRLRTGGRGVWQALGDSAGGAQPGALGAPLVLGRLRDARAPTHAPAGGRRLGEVAWTHPLLAGAPPQWRASLRATRVFRYWQIEATDDAQVVMRLDDGSPLLLVGNHDEAAATRRGPALLWTTTLSPQWTDLPLRSAFVPFMHRCAAYLLGAQAQLPSVVELGAPLTWRTGIAARQEGRLVGPSGAVVTRAGSQEADGPVYLSELGRWRAQQRIGGQWRGAADQDVWVQAAVGDSDLSPLADMPPAAQAPEETRASAPERGAPWAYLWLLLAALLVSVDAVLAPASSPKKAARVGVVPRD